MPHPPPPHPPRTRTTPPPPPTPELEDPSSNEQRPSDFFLISNVTEIPEGTTIMGTTSPEHSRFGHHKSIPVTRASSLSLSPFWFLALPHLLPSLSLQDENGYKRERG